MIAGEGEWSFRELCERLLSGKKPLNKLISGRSPDLESLVSPYSLYTDEDIRQRVVYVEASRGCPFRCEFCLSSLDKSVRNFPLDAFLEEMDSLYQRGLRHFKFVDRTFNLKIEFSRKILEFFLERYTPGLFLHFEMIPDRLPTELRELIARFPPGALQFEVGVQSLNDDVSARISRRQDLGRMADNFAFLRDETGVHVHADLIVGLPGEDIGSFATGFERLRAMGAQEIQVGILKRLRGTPIARHDEEWEMVYSQHPPYEVLHTKAFDFFQMQAMKRFAHCWNGTANSGNFRQAVDMLLNTDSPFERFMNFTRWLFASANRVHAIAQNKLADYLLRFMVDELGMDEERVEAAIVSDYEARDARPPVPVRRKAKAESRRAGLKAARRQEKFLPS